MSNSGSPEKETLAWMLTVPSWRAQRPWEAGQSLWPAVWWLHWDLSKHLFLWVAHRKPSINNTFPESYLKLPVSLSDTNISNYKCALVISESMKILSVDTDGIQNQAFWNWSNFRGTRVSSWPSVALGLTLQLSQHLHPSWVPSSSVPHSGT